MSFPVPQLTVSIEATNSRTLLRLLWVDSMVKNCVKHFWQKKRGEVFIYVTTFLVISLVLPRKKNQKSPRFHVFVKQNICLLSFSFHLDFDFLGELISWMQRSFQDEEFQILLRFFSLSVLALYLVGIEIKQNTEFFYSGSFLQSPNNKQNLSILGLIHVRHMPVS